VTRAAIFLARLMGGPGARKRLLAGSRPLAGLDPPPGGWGGVRLKKGPGGEYRGEQRLVRAPSGGRRGRKFWGPEAAMVDWGVRNI